MHARKPREGEEDPGIAKLKSYYILTNKTILLNSYKKLQLVSKRCYDIPRKTIISTIIKLFYFFSVLLEEIRAARDNMGKYTRKTSQDYEDTFIVKTKDYRGSLIKLMMEVRLVDVHRQGKEGK